LRGLTASRGVARERTSIPDEHEKCDGLAARWNSSLNRTA
jgi:hypothetical protein